MTATDVDEAPDVRESPRDDDLDHHTEERADWTEQPKIAHFVVEEDTGDTDDEEPLFAFTLGRPDEPVEGARILYAQRPKTAIVMDWAMLDPDEQDPRVIIPLVRQFIDTVLVAESREYVWGRLRDPDDRWDIDLLVPLINRLKARWYGRPPGRATGSSGSPGTRGPRSTGRKRSKGNKTRRKG